MTKQQLKKLIQECINETLIDSSKEIQSEGYGIVNRKHRFRLNLIKQDNEKIKDSKYKWQIDGWEDREEGLIRLLRTNPKTEKIQTGIIDRDGNFVIKP
jgi:hypothetical protein